MPEVIAAAARSASRVIEVAEAAAVRVFDSSELARVERIAHPLFDSFAARALRLVGRPIWRTHERSPEQTIILTRILKAVRTTERPVVVIDLDDTLFAMLWRHVAIFREYGRRHKVPLMELIGPEHLTSWNKSKVLVDNLGLDPTWFARHEHEIEEFWRSRFFTNSYIAHDLPLPGAAEYVRQLHEAGAHIVYMSGRSEARMLEGTVQSLRRHHFPTPDQGKVTLMLKTPEFDPHRDSGMPPDEIIRLAHRSDVAFKEWAIEKVRPLGNVVACIDNEPANINLFRDKFFPNGGGFAVWVATTMARPDIIPDPRVLIIHGFLL
ncbi:MAG: hypothetical protein HYT76_07665 [Deltaproteobacteria bacterium]|nr:hypothetical protein [Deltaproteobacteria bacterium]